ncbi:MAG TPA: hypothetical protein HA267_06190 [Candidatus Poseidonia sp.]|nr:hypothetical protein [Poseidonia sp.]
MSPKAIIALRWSWMNKPILKNALSFSISGSVAPSMFLSEKFGVFEQALWGQSDARFAHVP